MTERASLLDQPVHRAVADLCVNLLDAARAASGRLIDAEDAEALHDFRVALRRLRTLLRGFRPELGRAISKKVLRRVRDVTQSTSATRDAEVQLAWIGEHRAALGKRPGPGVPWLIARLEESRDHGYEKARGEAVQQFRRLDRRLRRVLNAIRLDSRPEAPTLATAAAQLVRQEITELEQEVAAAHSPRDQEAIHSARIAGKRLRYLLEPLLAEADQLGPVIKQLRQLQNLLGEMHDVQVLLVDLGDAGAEAAAERARRLHQVAVRHAAPRAPKSDAGPRPASAGLLALARLARRVQDELFQRLESEWGAGQLASLTGEVSRFAEALAARAVVPAPPSSPPRARRAPLRRRLSARAPSSEIM
ncbi:MAG TPA: CHAD domain-containing protein [Gemmatimonadales bacterium]|nr:CHAD domain-containing protein [Gemmatimonadales bacterium]